MALPRVNANTNDVKAALGYYNEGTDLTLSPNINPFSKWKPIDSKLTTMTLTELKNRNYGLEMLSARTPEALYDMVIGNKRLGFKYIRPQLGNPKRFADFRGYEHGAPAPFISAALPEMVVNKVGMISIGGMAVAGTDTTVGYDDVCNLDKYGNPDNFFNGMLVKYGNNKTWWFSKNLWGRDIPAEIQGKEVEVLEFFTNFEHNKMHPNFPSPTDNAIFYALPKPFAKVKFIVTTDIGPGPGGGGDGIQSMKGAIVKANGTFDFIRKKVTLQFKVVGTDGRNFTSPLDVEVSSTDKRTGVFYTDKLRGGYRGEANQGINVGANETYPHTWNIEMPNPNALQQLHIFVSTSLTDSYYINVVHFDIG